MNEQNIIASDEDLFAGFDSYMSSDELGLFADDTPEAASVSGATWLYHLTIQTPC